jgi:hypothetical protein
MVVRVAMDRDGEDIRPLSADVLRAVAVMAGEVEHRHARHPRHPRSSLAAMAALLMWQCPPARAAVAWRPSGQQSTWAVRPTAASSAAARRAASQVPGPIGQAVSAENQLARPTSPAGMRPPWAIISGIG